jgi:PAS domain S-box-containing protein
MPQQGAEDLALHFPEIPPASGCQAGWPGGHDSATLLLVDDVRTNLLLLESALMQDYRLLMASSGEQALQIAASQRPDLVLLDVMMPGMDGFETARALRRLPALHEVPVIFVTSLSDDAAQVCGLELGAVDFIAKPISVEVLRLRVGHVIERQRLRAESVRHQRELAHLLQRQTQARILLESVFNASIDALLVTDCEFNLLQANDRAYPLFGFSADQGVEGMTLRASLRQLMDGAMLAPEALLETAAATECLLSTVDGREVPVAITCRSFQHEPDELGYLVSVRDISARLLLEAEKRSANERLREAQLALEDARQRELETGSAIQQRLLFGHPPPGQEGFTFAYFSQASQGVAGDFYTFTRLNANCIEILTGDVMGKGVAAALIAASILSAYRKCLSELMAERDGASPSPAELVNAMHAVATPELVKLESFVTLSLLRLDRCSGVATWVNAGHTPTLLARVRDAEVLGLDGDNLPLGVLDSEVYCQRSTRLECGDMLLLYSDGLSETMNDEGLEYGAQRIARILGLGLRADLPPSAVLSSLRTDLLEHSGRTHVRDDCTAILIQAAQDICDCHGSHGRGTVAQQLELPRSMHKLHLLRQAIASFAADQPEDWVQALTLAAYEGATNIVRHARTRLPDAPLSVLLERSEQQISVTLVQAGEPFMPQAEPCPDFSGGSVGGFGLYIISRCVDAIDYGCPMPGLGSIALRKNLAVQHVMLD